MSSLGTPWRPSNPAGGGAATTTDETTHRRRAHADVQRRTSDSACQPDVRRIGIRTRVFSHSKTSAVALPAAGANLSVSVSTGAPSGSGVTRPAPTSRARTSSSMGTPHLWTPRLTTICQLDAPGITYRVYGPGSTRTPAISAGDGTWVLVASLAPSRHGWADGASPPLTFRPRAHGRLEHRFMVPPPAVTAVAPNGLG